MPIVEYVCPACGKSLERIVPYDPKEPECCKGVKMNRIISITARTPERWK